MKLQGLVMSAQELDTALHLLQSLVIGLATVNLCVGIYTLASRRVPRWLPRRARTCDHKKYGQAQILVFVWIILLILPPFLGWGPIVRILCLFVGIGVMIAGIWLSHSRKQRPSPSSARAERM
ncbi:hypothetical protein J5X84_42320 [Streptosporangiaceae bacterium NEAU-GS5]|nr:hypothetical protein [Streptosporangiaceae bacterium NEAU-GS5]